jgi:hypothetical protein
VQSQLLPGTCNSTVPRSTTLGRVGLTPHAPTQCSERNFRVNTRMYARTPPPPQNTHTHTPCPRGPPPPNTHLGLNSTLSTPLVRHEDVHLFNLCMAGLKKFFEEVSLDKNDVTRLDITRAPGHSRGVAAVTQNYRVAGESHFKVWTQRTSKVLRRCPTCYVHLFSSVMNEMHCSCS